MTDEDARIREAHHRCSNDLQMVVSLLTLMARDAAEPALADGLREAAARVGLLAQARRSLLTDGPRTLASSLRDVCAALQPLAEPRGVRLALLLELDPDGLEAGAVTAASMAVNELATNAIKHAFADGAEGTVTIALTDGEDGALFITVDDDGLPLKVQPGGDAKGGLGLTLARRLVAQHGRLIAPMDGGKQFRIVLDPAAPVPG